MIKRIWPALLFIFKGKPALSEQAQAAIEKYLIEVDHITKPNLGKAYGPVSRHWLNMYSAMHLSLSKSFYNQMLKVMAQDNSSTFKVYAKSL